MSTNDFSRDAKDQEESDTSDRDAVLDRIAGLWKDRDDLPDFAALRKEWDRRIPTLGETKQTPRQGC